MSKNFEENVYSLIAELKQFIYMIDSIDHLWDVIFPHKIGLHTVYYYIRVTKYQDIFYIGHVDGELCSLEVRMNTSVQVAPSFGSSYESDGNLDRRWDGPISSARNW